MDPQHYSRSKNNCTVVCDKFPFCPRICAHTHTKTPSRGTKKRARNVTVAARKEGRGASWPGGQATRRRASCYTRQRKCKNPAIQFFIHVLFGFSIVLRDSGSSAESDPVITCQNRATLNSQSERHVSRGYLAVFATSNAESTRHRARPGPKLAPSVHADPLRSPRPRAR